LKKDFLLPSFFMEFGIHTSPKVTQEFFFCFIIPEMRAALCTLALTLYIDHEPFNQLNLPNMCRIYKNAPLKRSESKSPTRMKSLFSKHKMDSDKVLLINEEQSEKESVGKSHMEEQLFGLVDNILVYLEKEVSYY